MHFQRKKTFLNCSKTGKEWLQTGPEVAQIHIGMTGLSGPQSRNRGELSSIRRRTSERKRGFKAGFMRNLAGSAGLCTTNFASMRGVAPILVQTTDDSTVHPHLAVPLYSQPQFQSGFAHLAECPIPAERHLTPVTIRHESGRLPESHDSNFWSRDFVSSTSLNR